MTTRTVVIVGGGTAGWLTAGIIASKNPQVKVSLVESPQVKNLGVGEGTWPTMRETLRTIGIDELTFLARCQASFKQGSKFVGWREVDGPAYYDPFTVPNGYGQYNLASHFDDISETERARWFAHRVSPQPAVCEAGKAPKTLQMAGYACALNYGYHLDAGAFVTLLHEHCTTNLSVNYVSAHVECIHSHASGAIRSLQLDDGQCLAGDLFIDCSGFASVLIGKHYQIPLTGCQDVLFNNRALAVQVEHQDPQQPLAATTLATAQPAGWIWDIALTHRRGIGHVYSSEYAEDEEIHEALMRYIEQDKSLASHTVTPRKISFTPGYRTRFWHHNCVAIGVSAGFVEPLEATALVLIEKSAQWIAHQLPGSADAMEILAHRFNTLTTRRWQEIIDFLKLHYALNKRTDSRYWCDHRQPQSWPSSLRDSLTLWQTQPPWIYDSLDKHELFSAASQQYVLYGMGYATTTTQHTDAAQAMRLFKDTERQAGKLMAGLPDLRSYLKQIQQTYQQTTSKKPPALIPRH